MYSESSKSSESSDQVRLAHLWVDFRVISWQFDTQIDNFEKGFMTNKREF